MDSKKSPLALLAQTCSQIGADSNNVKPLITPLEKNKKVDTTKIPTANAHKLDKTENRLAFKPYEMNVLSKKHDDHRPLSKSSSVDEIMSDEKIKKENHLRANSRNSNSGSPSSVNSSSLNNCNENSNLSVKNEFENVKNENDKLHGERSERKSPAEKGASPIIRSGLEMLHSQQKEALGLYKPGFNPFYPGMESNPAFRSSYPSALSQHHASMLAAAAGYSSNPYLSYARVKTPTGGDALVPVCKDPYCTGCQYSSHSQQMMMGVPCPQGCTQCDHQKYGLAMAMSQLPGSHPFAQMSKPYGCNWIVGDSYCGKRFNTTDELIQHMRTHSPNLSDPATAASILAAQQSASLMSPLGYFPGMHRSPYATAAGPLSPMSASRYHPYAKPGGVMPSAASPYGTYNPAALSPYYPPYSLYGQRMGAAVHP